MKKCKECDKEVKKGLALKSIFVGGVICFIINMSVPPKYNLGCAGPEKFHASALIFLVVVFQIILVSIISNFNLRRHKDD